MEVLKALYVYPYAPDLKEETTVYPLSKEGLDNIPEDITHGNYRIGVIWQLFGSFYVKYIGSADHGLKK